MVIHSGVKCLKLFTEDDNEVATEVVSMGCCEIVVECMSRYPSHVGIITACCEFCSAAASSGETWEEDWENKVRLVKAGVLEAVCKAIELHMNHIQILNIICECLGHMASENYENKERLARIGACELLINILRDRGSDEDVIGAVCKAVSFMASNGACKTRFLGTDVLSLLDRYSWRYRDLQASIARAKERLEDKKLPSDQEAAMYPDTIKDSSHEHVLRKIRCNYDYGKFGCDICMATGGGWVYNCAECQFDVHLVCADTRGLVICRGDKFCTTLGSFFLKQALQTPFSHARYCCDESI